MIDMTYKDFLEKVVALTERQVYGKVELRYHNSGAVPYYDIMAKFDNTNIQLALSCPLGCGTWDVYTMSKAHPNKVDVLIEQCAKDTVDCLKSNALAILFKN